MNPISAMPSLDAVLGSADAVAGARLAGEGPSGSLPLTPEMLRERPSGDIFGLTQDVGMGWSAAALTGPQFVIVSTLGGLATGGGEMVIFPRRQDIGGRSASRFVLERMRSIGMD